MEKDTKYSISDVAELLGVSASTVSRALNGKKGVSEKQREKIRSVARELGYQPNTFSQETHHDAPKMVVLILGDIRNPYYSDLVFNIQRRLSENGYMLVVFNSEYDVEQELHVLKTIQSSRNPAAGLILVTAQSTEVEEVLETIDLPKVLVNRILPSYRGDSVLTDNFQAGYMAAMHLIDLYHTDIGFIRGPVLSSASTQRFEGFKQALRNFNLPLKEEFMFQSDLKIESGKQIAKQLLASGGKRPTAMIAANDLTAIGFMDECKKEGLTIPEDLSIVSFDDISYAALEGISLTTINPHVEEMSKEVARLMLKQLDGDRTHPERVILSPELIVRHSTVRR